MRINKLHKWIAAAVMFATASGAAGEKMDANLKLKITWPTFLDRHDMIWPKLPRKRESEEGTRRSNT